MHDHDIDHVHMHMASASSSKVCRRVRSAFAVGSSGKISSAVARRSDGLALVTYRGYYADEHFHQLLLLMCMHTRSKDRRHRRAGYTVDGKQLDGVCMRTTGVSKPCCSPNRDPC